MTYRDTTLRNNKDEEIHKSESVRTKQAEYWCISLNKIVSNFVTKRLKYRILFKDILTFLGHVYRVASLMILYLVEIGFIITKKDA